MHGRLNRNDNDIVFVERATGTFGREDADDLEGYAVDFDHFSDGVFVAEQTLYDGDAEDGDALAGEIFLVGEKSAVGGFGVVDVDVGGGGTGSLGVGVVAVADDLDAGADFGGDGLDVGDFFLEVFDLVVVEAADVTDLLADPADVL